MMTLLLRLFMVMCLWSGLARAADYPMTLEHKFGSTVIAVQPRRVATLDYTGADDLLALGVQPVALRRWYGDYPQGVWPWAAPLLSETPVILSAQAPDYEAIAATRPDVIFALWSGISQAEYDKLSAIAPVVAVPRGMGDFAMPWDARARMVGRVLGREDHEQDDEDGSDDQFGDG